MLLFSVKVLMHVHICHVGNLTATEREPSLSYRETSETERFRQPAPLHLFISVCFQSTLGKAEVNAANQIEKTAEQNPKSTYCCLIPRAKA